MPKYEIIIYWSNEDQAFIADVPELPGSIAHRDSKESTQRQADEAIRPWIGIVPEFGDPIPGPISRR